MNTLARKGRQEEMGVGEEADYRDAPHLIILFLGLTRLSLISHINEEALNSPDKSVVECARQ